MQKVDYELVNLMGLLLIDEVGRTFHNNNVVQKRNIFLKPTIVYVVFDARHMIYQVQVANDELRWHHHFCTLPCCSELPVPLQTNTRKKKK